MDLSSLLTVVGAVAAVTSVIYAAATWRAARNALLAQALIDLRKEYRTPEMLVAIRRLRELFEQASGDPDRLVAEYDRICASEAEWVATLPRTQQLEAEEVTLHNLRRLVSHFYWILATTYVTGILPRKFVLSTWYEVELNIIPQVLIPIERHLSRQYRRSPTQTEAYLKPYAKLYDDVRKKT